MPLSPADIHTAARHLARCERGRQTLAALNTLLQIGAASLDSANQGAVLTLLGGVWSGRASTTLDAIALALDLPQPPLWLEDDTDQPPPREPQIV